MKSKILDTIFFEIAGIPDTRKGKAETGKPFAESGDLIFLITHHPYKTLKDEIKGKNWKEIIRLRSKPWLGFNINYLEEWHVAIYFMQRKRREHARINSWIIHSTRENGVHVKQITPSYFTNPSFKIRTRMEILKFEGISTEQRNNIVNFANSKVGLDFDRSKWRHQMLPYAFGLPNKFHNQNQFSCQQLAIAAYAAAGIYFPHPYKAFPIFNIGRYLGHPLGHPKDRVDPRYPYLMDHHIYRDPRFVLKAAVYQDQYTDEIILQTENLKKYSWNEALREKYIKKGYLDP
jgi:hypothetical protein